MPEPTRIEVDFVADLSDLKRGLSEFESIGKQVKATAGAMGLSMKQAMKPGMFAEANQAALAYLNTSKDLKTGTDEVKDATIELGEATEKTAGSFGNMGAMVSRMAVHMAAYEAVMFAAREITGAWKSELDFSKQEAVFKNLYGDTADVAKGFAQIREELGQDPKKVSELTEVMRELDTTGTTAFSDLASEAKKLTEVSDEYGLSAKGVAAEIEKIGESGRLTTKELQDLNREFRGAFKDELKDAQALDDEITRLTGSIKEQEQAAREAKTQQSEWQRSENEAEREVQKTGTAVTKAGSKEEQARAALIQAQMYGPGRFETNAPQLQEAYRQAVAERQQAQAADRAARANQAQIQAAQPAAGAADTLQALKDQLAQAKSRREEREWTGSMDVGKKVEALADPTKQARVGMAPMEGAANFANALGNVLNTGMVPLIAPMGNDLKEIAGGMKALLHLFEGGH
jgi:hypothetical protein